MSGKAANPAEFGQIHVPKKQKLFDSYKLAPYVFVLPFILSFMIFFIYPIISTIMMSFQEIAGPEDVKFIGFKNYVNLVNPHFFNALKVSTVYTALTIAVLVPLPILLAVLLNSASTIGKNFFRSALFIPALTSVIVAGIFYRYTFSSQETALANQMVGFLGLKPQEWLGQKYTAMFVMVLFCTWRWLGVNIIYFLSGLQGIPLELYEAADIDGASAINKFFKITIPSLRPIIIYVITISVYGGYSMFAESFSLWASARSPADIGLTIVAYIYSTGFNNNEMGFASAIGITLLGIVMLINVLQLAFFGLFKKERD